MSETVELNEVQSMDDWRSEKKLQMSKLIGNIFGWCLIGLNALLTFGYGFITAVRSIWSFNPLLAIIAGLFTGLACTLVFDGAYQGWKHSAKNPDSSVAQQWVALILAVLAFLSTTTASAISLAMGIAYAQGTALPEFIESGITMLVMLVVALIMNFLALGLYNFLSPEERRQRILAAAHSDLLDKKIDVMERLYEQTGTQYEDAMNKYIPALKAKKGNELILAELQRLGHGAIPELPELVLGDASPNGSEG